MIADLEQDYQKIQKEEKRIKGEIKEIEGKIKIFSIISWLLVAVGFIVIIVTAPTYQGLRLSEIGDFLGGTVATIWSLASLLFIFVAFLGQQKQMLYQNLELLFSRFELKSTREELKGQKEQMIEQNDTMRVQRFETTFFNMLLIFNEIVKNTELNLGEDTNNKTGKCCFIVFHKELKEFYHNLPVKFNKSYKDINKCFSSLLENRGTELQHYFLHVTQILFIIENSNIENRKKYIDIWKAQLSNFEYILIFYYSLSNFSANQFTVISGKHEIFKDIKKTELFADFHYRWHSIKLKQISKS